MLRNLRTSCFEVVPWKEWRSGKVELCVARGWHRGEERYRRPRVASSRITVDFSWDVGLTENKQGRGLGVVNRNHDDVKGNLSVIYPTVGAYIILLWDHLERSIPPHERNSRKVPFLLLQTQLPRIFGSIDAPDAASLYT